MQILVINAGRSSVKFSVFERQEQLFKSALDKLEDIAAGIEQIPDILKKQGIIEPTVVAHRVAHGGDVFKDACQIDDSVIRTIEANILLAPLHNPPNLAGIRMAQQRGAHSNRMQKATVTRCTSHTPQTSCDQDNTQEAHHG